MTPVTESIENQENTADPVRARHQHQPNRLYRVLALVGIVAGSLFIVATVFFSGFILGQHGGGGPHHGPHRALVKPFPPGMGPDGPMGPGGGPRSALLTPPSAPAQPSTPPRP